MNTTTNLPNPIVKTTALRAYPGWTVREYANGMFDGDWTRGPGCSPGFDSFAETVAWIRDYERQSSEA